MYLAGFPVVDATFYYAMTLPYAPDTLRIVAMETASTADR
jgi:hypothetical protein